MFVIMYLSKMIVFIPNMIIYYYYYYYLFFGAVLLFSE